MAFPDLVIVLPGIAGSRLSKDGKDIWGTSGGVIWRALASGGDTIRSLMLSAPDDPTVDDLGDGFVASGLITDLHIIPGLWKIDGYTGLIRRLQTDLGLEAGKNLLEFPYDWRRDNRVSARKLQRAAHDWLRDWRTSSGNATAKIVFVVHSMGGLVASYFIEALEGWKDTRALISFGTPYRGSLNALGYLANGFAKGIGPFRFDLTPILSSFTSVYQLLPAFRCVDTGDGALQRVGEMTGLPRLDAARAAQALAFYQEIEARRKQNGDLEAYKAPKYETYPIVGMAQPTFQSASFSGGSVTLLQTVGGEDNSGDGTVPRVSATPLDMSQAHREIYVSEAHASLQNFDAALVNLIAILKGTQIDLSGFNFSTFNLAPKTLSVDVDDVYASSAIAIRATPSEDVEVTAQITAASGERSPLTLRRGGAGGGYVAETALPPGAYRVVVSAHFQDGPVSVTDIFLVMSDGGAQASPAKKGTGKRTGAASKSSTKAARARKKVAPAAPSPPPGDAGSSGAKPEPVSPTVGEAPKTKAAAAPVDVVANAGEAPKPGELPKTASAPPIDAAPNAEDAPKPGEAPKTEDAPKPGGAPEGGRAADTADAGSLVTLRVALVQGDLTKIRTPVAIAPRYDGLALAGSTRAFDRILDSWLSRIIDIGIVGSGLGQLFPVDVDRFFQQGKVGANYLLLASMGEPGRFASDTLQFLVSNIVVAVKSGATEQFATPLIGTRRKELSVAEAIRAFVDGVLDGFERFSAIADAVTENQVSFGRSSKRPLDVTLVDLDFSRLIEMEKALTLIKAEYARRGLVLDVGRPEPATSAPASDPDPPGSDRDVEATLLQITRSKTASATNKDGSDIFRFSALSQFAAVPLREVEVNKYWLRALPDRLAGSTSKKEQEKLGVFFSNCLFPDDFRTLISGSRNIIFEVDDTTAKYPWEMAAERAFSRTSFLGRKMGVSRQFRTLLSPPPTSPPPLNKTLKALVIADPAAGPLALPHARTEGAAVVEVLGQASRAWAGEFTICVTARIGSRDDGPDTSHDEMLDRLGAYEGFDVGRCDPLELAMQIVDEKFDMIHYAGHGFCDAPTGRAGWVFAADCFLTAQEIFRVRQVPRLVFANACFSAVTAEGGAATTIADQNSKSVGLAQAFFARGIPNFIGAGWQVGDESAETCARRFYDLVLGLQRPEQGGTPYRVKPTTIGDALRFAREHTVESNASSSTWGAYQHYGRVGDKLLPSVNEPRTGQTQPGTHDAAQDPAQSPPVSRQPPLASPQDVPPGDRPAPADHDMVYVNGIDATTGQYAVPPRSIDDVARSVLMRPGVGQFTVAHMDSPRSFGLTFAVDLTKLEQAGWGVVFHESTPDAVKAALAPLLALRRQQAGSLYQELDFKTGEQTRTWYQRHNISPGNVDPEIVPYYLLLIGPPDLIPFEFQYLGGVEYAMGRPAFDTPADYEQYARSVVAYEADNAVPNAKEIAFWGTQHRGDPATALSASMLVTPLANGLPDAEGALKRPIHTDAGFAQTLSLGAAATKAKLLETLHAAKPPAMLFTASHGMQVPSGKPIQSAAQGALLCQDWTGLGSIRPEHYLAATDVGDDANVKGLVAFLFACFGAGTPDLDQFPLDLSFAGKTPQLAPKPFMSALPRRLLTHPNGGALAVIGHVDRAWGFSIQAQKTRGAQIGTFRNSVGLILTGTRVGHALSGNFSARYSALSTALASATAPTLPASMQPSERDLVNLWLERNDAQNYVLLGDPAGRVRSSDLIAG